MKIILNKKRLPKIIGNEKNLGFVPTMGALHLGHISLIKKSLINSNKTIVSIFVNRYQFNQKNDFKNYPKSIKKDISILKNLKVDYLYLPKEKDIYPKGLNKKIKISPFSKKLCGKFRPGHFKSVVDVVDRFVKILKPKKIYLGEKDMQQLKLIENYFKRNNINCTVIKCKTIREFGGLAYSSRNILLTKNEKKIASKIYKFIKGNKKKLIKSQSKLNSTKKKIIKLGALKIDYINMLDTNKIFNIGYKKSNWRIFIAYYLRQVRLIDNI